MIIGMDEAGRGPAIGPIVFGLVGVTEEQEKFLRDKGIDDSKNLTPKKRNEFESIIQNNSSFYDTLVIHAHVIDEKRKIQTMNQIEVEGFLQLITPYTKYCSTLQIDAADVNASRFGDNFKSLINGEIISEHKADSNFIAVAAASILAKQKRDKIISNFQEDMNKTDPDLPDFGSGYPLEAQPFLREYVKKYHKLPTIARKTWKTCETILEEFLSQQSSLTDYF